MGLFDTFHFDEEDYYENAGGVALGVGGSLATGGMSLVHSAYSARQMSVDKQQRRILERILAERGEDKPRKRKRDMVGGAAVTAVSLGAAVAIGNVVSAGTSEIISEASVNATPEVVTSINPYDGLTYYEIVSAPICASSTAAAIATTHAAGKGAELVSNYVATRAMHNTLGNKVKSG